MSEQDKKAREEATKGWIEQNPLRAWRKREGFQAAAVAGMASSTPNSMKNWERGHVRPCAAKMAKLAELMGTRQITLEGQWTDWENARP